MVPTEFFREEIAQGLLAVLETEDALPQIEYPAIYRSERGEPIADERLTIVKIPI